uniref:ATP-binding protein n=1 Tax=Faecalibacterium prausnitzii TaxID=853 RepID=UPI004038EBE6
KLVRENFCDGFGDCLPGCPTGAITFEEREAPAYDEAAVQENKKKKELQESVSRLRNWPVQIKLAPVHAPYFEDAKLLIAADCTAYAYANFHQEFMRGKVTLIGCPKLDAVDYSEKLTEILRNNDIQSVTILRMEVPCCGGLEMAAKKALQTSGKFIPWQVVTISIDGKILD